MISGDYWITMKGDLTPLDVDKHQHLIQSKIQYDICEMTGNPFTEATWKKQKQKIVLDFLDTISPVRRINYINQYDDSDLYKITLEYYDVDEETAKAAEGDVDYKKFLIEYWNWKYLTQNILETYKLLQDDFEAIYKAIHDILKKESIEHKIDNSTIRFEIREHHNKEVHDYSLLQIFEGTKKPLPSYGDLITPAGLNFNYYYENEDVESFKGWLYNELTGQYGSMGAMVWTNPGQRDYELAGIRSKYTASYMKKKQKKKQKKK